MENRFRDRLQKKKMEGRSRDKGGWRLRAPWEMSWSVQAFVALVLAGVWLLHRG